MPPGVISICPGQIYASSIMGQEPTDLDSQAMMTYRCMYAKLQTRILHDMITEGAVDCVSIHAVKQQLPLLKNDIQDPSYIE